MAKVLFLQNYWYESPAIMALSALLKAAGHQAVLEIGNTILDFSAVIQKESPDIIGFSLMSGLHLWGVEITKQIRQMTLSKQPYIIYGGPHPTFFPEILSHSLANAICIGEGEYCLVELADCLNKGEVPDSIENLSLKIGEKIKTNPLRSLAHLDNLPFMDHGIYRAHKTFQNYPTEIFMAGRGCPFNCTFCYNKTVHKIYRDKGQFVRFRSPENVIEEIIQNIKKWKFRTVYFIDDTFGLKKSWVLSLLKLYKQKVKLPFICKIRADTVDEEMVVNFKEANCVLVQFAVEVADENTRINLLNKQIRDEDIFRTASLLKKYNIKFLTYNMVGLPGDTIDNVVNLIKLNAKLKTSYPWCSIFNPYPGTELADYCVQKGYMDADFHPDQLETTFHKAVMVKTSQQNQISNLHKLFGLGVFCPYFIPFIVKISKLKPNKIFTGVFLLTNFLNYIRSERLSFFEAFMFGLRNVRVNLGSKTKKKLKLNAGESM